VLCGTTAGVVLGGLLGALGSVIPGDARVVVATVLAVPAAIVAVIELRGRRIAPLQCDQETPQRWLLLGPLRWAAVNGAVLGAGFTTRIGFALFYLVPAAALLVGNALVGAAVYAAYAFSRTGGSYVFLHADRSGRGFEATADAMYRRRSTARAACAGVLLAASGLTFAGIGLGSTTDGGAEPRRVSAPAAAPPVVGCDQRAEPAARTAGPADVVSGPLFFVGVRDAATEPSEFFRRRSGRDPTWKAPVVVGAGRVVSVRVARFSRGVRLAYGRDRRDVRDLRDGLSAVTFQACLPDEPAFTGGVVGATTGWAGAILVDGPRCVRLVVHADGEARPRTVVLGFGRRRCRS